MYPPPNELYSAFAFFGFVLCAIPFYWHFKARNTGTCLYMIWTGLGCLLQCINSIVWNKNMVNRAPVYCDISVRIQAALNVAIPACSLCINRQLYRVARRQSVGMKDANNRRIVLIDLLIGVGIPVLQMVTQYVVSIHRYIIFEDIGPFGSNASMLPTLILFNAWPLAIGIVSFFYCVVNIYTFYKREIQCRQMILSTSGFSRSRYLRLMAISSADVLGTIPLSTFIIVSGVKTGIEPWKSWADTHSQYSVIIQIASFTWKNIPQEAVCLELYRWSLVASSFVFFALFGFAVEAREHYYRFYKWVARCVSYSVSAAHGALHASAPPVPHAKRNGLGGVTVTVPIIVSSGQHKDSLSITDLSSMTSFSPESAPNPNSPIDQVSHSDTISVFHSAKSFDESEMQDQSSPPAGMISLTAAPASLLPYFSDASGSTIPAHASPVVETV